MRAPFLDDPDFRLYVGDAREVLLEMPDGSIDCCVTSPPYWGLRDYGADGQIGLEPTVEEFVEELVAIFGQVRRVLADHGTVWLNLGDSYGHGGPGARDAERWPKQSRNDHPVGSDRRRNTGVKAKDLVGMPWRVALALQADGWHLRSDIIWSKPNPMPESVTDRPTKAHEYIFLLAKRPTYFFDQEAVREPFEGASSGNWSKATFDARAEMGRSGTYRREYSRPIDPPQAETLDGSAGEAPRGLDGRRKTVHDHATPNSHENYDNIGNGHERWPNGGRNIRTVWDIPTQSYEEAHFATFPEALADRCIKAGCPELVCATCGTPRRRVVEASYANPGNRSTNGPRSEDRKHLEFGSAGYAQRLERISRTVGWTDCGHDDWRVGVVLDPFMGSGTTALVARKQSRHAVGIELSVEYAALCARRVQQLSLFAEAG